MSRTANVLASPPAPVAMLHTNTPTAISLQRGKLRSNAPNIGAVSMYETRKAEASKPDLNITSASSSLSEPNMERRISGSTAASTWRSM